MATVGVRELKAKASHILQRAEGGESFLVTRHGRPVAVVLPFNLETEDLIFAQAPAFIKLRDSARSQHWKCQSLDWGGVKTTSAEGSSAS